MEFKSYKLPIDCNCVKSIESLYSGSSINPKVLLAFLYKTGVKTSSYQETFNAKDVIEFLAEKALLVESSETKNKNNFYANTTFYIDSDQYYLFFYKDNFIRVSISEDVSFDSNKKDKCSLVFFSPLNKESVDKEFLKFINKSSGPKVFLLNQEYGDFVFSKFSISLPKTFDLELNYGDNFKKINDKIVESLDNNHSGLYMFHGMPGTGKSTYIKYLSSVLKKDVIFFPTSLVQNITNPDIINLLIKKQNCILILEDAEKAITKREINSEASLVSTLLNMTDGILGDVLKLNIIVTYNCDRQDIDEALLRRGRLKAEHTFSTLSIDQCKKLVKKLKLNVDVKEEMTLADIYNYKNDDELIKNKEKLNEKPRIGFYA